MEQRTPLGIEFTRALTRQLVISQSYLLGRFVKGTSGALHQVGDYATGLENIAPFVRRDPPHSLRGKGPLAAIFIKLRLRWLLQNYVKPPRRSANYHPCDFILARLYAIMAGLRRINKTEILQDNGTFLSWLGLSRFPDQSTRRRFLKRMGSGSIRQLVTLHDQLRAQLFPLPRRRTTLTFDLDSVVLTVYGKPQFARLGYNPKKHGRRSYHPLVGFEAHLQEFWHGSLRPGNTVTSTGLVAFVRRCLDKVPSS